MAGNEQQRDVILHPCGVSLTHFLHQFLILCDSVFLWESKDFVEFEMSEE